MEKYDIMYLAKVQAEVTSKLGIGGPFGAAILDSEGNIITVDSNTVLRDNDPTAHAEINAIRSACKILGTHDLSGYTLYATGYPCPMCISAIIWANIREVYYGTDLKEAEDIGFRDQKIYDFIKGNVRKYFNADLANYLIENKLIESYFNNTTSDFENYNNTNNNFKDSNKNSYSFSQKLFEPISILDSDNNKFNSIDIRKGSEDLSNFNYYPSSFNFQRGEDSYDMMENPEKAFSNHLSPYFKH